MKILMLCEYFPPVNKIGAVRPAKLSEYIAHLTDAEITVVCPMPVGISCPETEETASGVTVRRIKRNGLLNRLHRKSDPAGGKGNVPLASSSGSVGGGIKRRILSLVLRFRDKAELSYSVSRAARLLRHEEFDVVWSTYNTEFGHLAARRYQSAHKKVKWIADFRDPTWTAEMSERKKNKMKDFAAKTAQNCDAVVAVTEGILLAHRDDFKGTPAYVITNGYDPRDRVPRAFPNDGIFRFVYTGELYNGKRDMTPLFRALQALASENVVDLNRVEVLYAGKSSGVFMEQLRQYPEIKGIDCGFVSREKAMEMQDRSQIPVLCSWCTKEDKHTLTGKFFEYLSAEKPMLCLISGDASGSALAESVRNHALGCCCEQANDKEDFAALCEFLKEQYTSYMETGKTVFSPDRSYISRFSYEEISKELYALMTALTEEHSEGSKG